MSEDSKRSVETPAEKLRDQDLAAATRESAETLASEGKAIDGAAKKAHAGIGRNLEAAEQSEYQSDKRDSKRRGSARRSREDVATTRSTSGAGYVFEDYVAAWLIVRMMRGLPMHGFNTPGHTVQLQTKALGHGIDDLVVTGLDTAGETITLHISCRSGLDIGPGGFRADFTEAAWTDWDRLDEHQRAHARFALITRGQHDGFAKTWADLQHWIGTDATPLALARIRRTQKHARVFYSLAGNPASAETSYSADASAAGWRVSTGAVQPLPRMSLKKLSGRSTRLSPAVACLTPSALTRLCTLLPTVLLSFRHIALIARDKFAGRSQSGPASGQSAPFAANLTWPAGPLSTMRLS